MRSTLTSSFGLFMLFIISCTDQSAEKKAALKIDTLTEEQKHLPEFALKGLSIANGLEIKSFAAEPMLQNPTNIDVDDKGRVWVTEAYNYRPEINGNPTNAAGDRIVILEDSNGDGKADTSKIFYQGTELNAPLGIAVLGNKVIVSQSPFVWVFYDDDGDDKADRKEILFQGIGGEQHDHGVHAFSFGADGKLYFNFGNEAHTLKDKNGITVRDQEGDEINIKKYREGLLLRCNADGSEVEVIGHNFRNPYEVAVDSYGGMWQSDNDDDGNRGTRINYVMQRGNYGYTDEMSGAGWSSNRTNMEDSIPHRHWHLNDPGAVPNMLLTGAGSPTGLLVYEGNLLPQVFHNQLIHCDAGPNVVRAYSIKKDGAGFSAGIENIAKGDKDPWFRPADISVAPDGSLIIADWYDPGVGGHAAGDQVKGRIYRVSPTGHAYTIKKPDYSSPEAALLALQNANTATRYKAFTALLEMGETAIPVLEKAWQTGTNPRMRARAFWVLVKMKNAPAARYIEEAINDKNPDLRMMGIRAVKENKNIDAAILGKLAGDQDVQVRRELALSLCHQETPDITAIWTTLAKAYDGRDRWYLEALGIGADQQWNKCMKAYLASENTQSLSASARDIIWRSRADLSLPLLAALAADSSTVLKDRLRYFRAFDFQKGDAKYAYLLKIIQHNNSNDIALNKLVLHALDIKSVRKSANAKKALMAVLDSVKGSKEYLELVNRYEVKSANPVLLEQSIQFADKELGRESAALLMKLGGGPMIIKTVQSSDTAKRLAIVQVISGVGTKQSIDLLQQIMLSKKYPQQLRETAAAGIGKSWAGEERVLTILKAKQVPEAFIPAVVSGVKTAWRLSVRQEAASYLPESFKNAPMKNAPVMNDLKGMTADIEAGKKIYISSCGVCHKAGELGADFGPALSEIGSKLPREGLLEAIVHPSAGIGFGYEGWELKMKDGSVLSGILASKTETDIEIKFPGGGRKAVKTSDVLSSTQMKTSMMTEGLHETMSTQDMANLIGFLYQLKKK